MPLLCGDLILLIASLLDIKSKIAWLSTCWQHRKLLPHILIGKQVAYSKIKSLYFRDIFVDVLIDTGDFYEINHYLMQANRLSSVEFGYDFDACVVFPPGLRSVTFGAKFNQQMIFQRGLWNIEFGTFFNNKVILPPGLHGVVFGNYFNQFVTLPAGLISATFGAMFNKPITLPPGLIRIKFGAEFNQPVILPEGLVCAIFSYRFNYPVIWPKSLKQLIIHRYYPHELPGGSVKISKI